jgi:hypothetical protein
LGAHVEADLWQEVGLCRSRSVFDEKVPARAGKERENRTGGRVENGIGL